MYEVVLKAIIDRHTEGADGRKRNNGGDKDAALCRSGRRQDKTGQDRR